MRRPSGFIVACAMMVLPLCLPASAHAQAAGAAAGAPAAGAQTAAPAAPAAQKLTFTGDVALWAFAINPDKTGDYEKVLEKLKASLQKITRPEVKQQMAGWKVIKNPTPQQDGSILYIHVISPVVKDADYSINALVYEAFTDFADRQAFYDMYKGAVKGAFFLIQGPAVADMSK